MKTKILLGLLAIIFLVCNGMSSKEEASLIPEGTIRVKIINDTCRKLCQTTDWLNHNIPSLLGPTAVFGGELQPGEVHTFDRNADSWDFHNTSIWRNKWRVCEFYVSEVEKKKWASETIIVIPEGTSIVEIRYGSWAVFK